MCVTITESSDAQNFISEFGTTSCGEDLARADCISLSIYTGVIGARVDSVEVGLVYGMASVGPRKDRRSSSILVLTESSLRTKKIAYSIREDGCVETFVLPGMLG